MLGDKANHIPNFHFAMASHAFLLCGAFLIPISFQAKYFNNNISYFHALVACFLGICSGLALVLGSLEHPFLLADNRYD